MLPESAFYPHLRNSRFILICGIRVLSSFAESAFYPHLRNPRFILKCGIRFRNPLPESASGIRFRNPHSGSAFYPTHFPVVIFTCPGQAASVKLHICEAIPSPLSLPLGYTVPLKQTFTIKYFVPCRHRDSVYTRRGSIQKRRQNSVLSLCVHTARMKSDKLQRIPE